MAVKPVRLDADLRVDQVTVCTMLGLGRGRIHQLERAGHVRRHPGGGYVLREVYAAMNQLHKEEVARAKSSSAGRERLIAAKARQIELRVAREAGTLCRQEENHELWIEAWAPLAEALRGGPAELTRDPVLRKRISDWLDRVCNEHADRAERLLSVEPPKKGRSAA
jgi:diketogulonate reductase-like aldo/keto reductase